MSENKYTGLIAGYHLDKPKYQQMVYDTTQPVADIAATVASLPMAFDLDLAIGAQLDAVGVRVGISRRVPTPLTGVYFTFDDAAVGFDLGVWQGPYDPDSGISILDDETYRTVIRAKIAANNWDGTNGSSKAILDLIFTDGTVAIIEDNQDMTMNIALSGKAPPPILYQLLLQGYLSVKPATVGIKYFITTTSDAPLFAFDVQNDSLAGFDTGAFGVVTSGA